MFSRKLNEFSTKQLGLILAVLFLTTAVNTISAQSFWSPPNGPYGGRIEKVVRVSPDTLLAASKAAYLFISTNNGNYWSSVNDVYAPVRTRTLEAIPGTRKVFGSQQFVLGMRQSLDGGLTWHPVDFFSDKEVLQVHYDRATGYLYAGTRNDGIFRSPDHGNTWEEVDAGLPFDSKSFVTMTTDRNGTLFVGFYPEGLYRSTDFGMTWQEIAVSFNGTNLKTIFCDQDNNLYAGTAGDGIYISSDGGDTWVKTSDGINNLFINTFTQDGNGTIYAGTMWDNNFVFYSYNGTTQTWEGISSMLLRSAVLDLIPYNGYVLIATAGQGLFHFDGINVYPRNQNLTAYVASEVKTNSATGMIYAGTRNCGIFQSSDGGNTWDQIFYQPEVNSVEDIVLIPEYDYFFVNFSFGGVYLSTDGGNSFSAKNNGLPTQSTNCLAYSPISGRLFVGLPSGDGIFVSDDWGDSWTKMDNGLDLGDYQSVLKIIVNSQGTVYAVLTHYDSDKPQGIYRSDDNGVNWEPINNGLPSMDVYNLFVDASDILYASTPEGIYTSKDDGDSWQQSSPYQSYYSTFTMNSQGRVYLSLENMLFYSDDHGDSWQEVENNDGNYSIRAMSVTTDDYLFAGTFGKGIVFSNTSTKAYFSITFSVDMSFMSRKGRFNPEVDQVNVNSSLTDWAPIKMDYVSDDVYQTTIISEGLSFKDTIYYAFSFQSGAETIWEDLNEARMLEINSEYISLPTVHFNNENGLDPLVRENYGEATSDTMDSFGQAWFDFNRDGWMDLAVISQGANVLYKNESGILTPVPGTPFSTDMADSRGITVGDFDNDGWPDIFVANMGAGNNALFRNQEGNDLVKVSGSILSSEGGDSRCATWADFDKDGWLDLFVGNGGGQKQFLYKNNGDGTFIRIENGEIVNSQGEPRACVAADFNNDGYTDLVVANSDNINNFLFINQGDGTFNRILSGELVTSGGNTKSISAGDVDNDGDLDLLVVNFNDPTVLYINDGNAGFTPRTIIAGQDPYALTGPFTSSGFADFDNDGWLDFFITGQGMNKLFINNRQGYFDEATGSDYELDGIFAISAASEDLDNDGANDLFASTLYEHNYFYRNGNYNYNNYIKFILRPTDSNRMGIGTKIYLWCTINGTKLVQMRELTAQSGRSAQSFSMINFGLGSAPIVDSLLVVWPSGKRSKLYDLAGNTNFELYEPTVEPPDVLTGDPVEVKKTYATVSGTVYPNGSETQVWFEYGTDTNYGNSVMVNQTPVNGSDSVPVQATFFNLTGNTVYHYRIVAQSEGGTAYGEDYTFRTLSANIVMENLDADLVSAKSARLLAQVTVDGLLSSVEFHYGATTSDDAVIAAHESPVSSPNPEQVTAAISDLIPNTQYFFKVVIQNDEGKFISEEATFTTLDYPQQITLSYTFDLPNRANPGDYAPEDYRILGLPGKNSIPIQDIADGYPGEDWMAYWDNGNDNNYFVAYDGSDMFYFRPGNAFWVVAKNDLSINYDVPSPELSPNSTVSIPLHPGWNLISNPFPVIVSWERVKYINGISDPIYTYNGSYQPSLLFRPYVGYYYFNSDNITDLNIPFLPQSSTENLPKELAWSMHIRLRSGEFEENCAYIGTSEQSHPGLDKFDFRKPHSPGQLPGVYFKRTEWDAAHPEFASDVRPMVDENISWEFTVEATPGEKATLIFEGQDLPENLDFYLVDEQRLVSQNIKFTPEYSFTPVTPKTTFKIVAGQPEAIEQLMAELLPKEFQVQANFPNPFNPSTTIPVLMPETGHVELVVYDVLGHRILQLFNGELAPGRHLFTWDGLDASGRRVPSGVYFYTVRFPNHQSVTRKMILMK